MSPEPAVGTARQAAAIRPARFLRQRQGRMHLLVTILAGAALVSLALEYGFAEPPVPVGVLVGVQLAAVAGYVLGRLYEIYEPTQRRAALRKLWLDGALLLLAAGVILIRLEFSRRPVLHVTTLYVGAVQVVLAVRLGIEAVRLNLALSQANLHPTRFLALTFAVLIALGTLALALPNATTEAVHAGPDFSVARHLLNCAFTATSAVCVTGLIVYETGTDFTVFGQIVILVLIQAGGLGIMIFGSAFGLLAGQRLSLKHSLVLQDAISYRTLGQLRNMILFIIVFTFVAEAIGAAVLFSMWHDAESVWRRLFHSVFHAVSAFCNAGFALQSDSLVAYSRSWQVYASIMPLIVLGGLGFPVLYDLWERLRAPHAVDQMSPIPRSAGNARRPRLSMHTRLVLVTTLVLIVVPTVLFVLLERFNAATSAGAPATIAGASWPGSFLDALFYSVTCRTAGFNTVRMDASGMSQASHMLGAILMFIGGSPASAAGGVKTVGIAVLLLEVWATLRGRAHVEVFRRTIPDPVARRAAVVIVVMFALVSVVTLGLCFTERVPLRMALFETVSACGTVGLSMGLTPELTTPGRVLIMLAMFAGRLGPLTVLVALAGQPMPARYAYPYEDVVIG